MRMLAAGLRALLGVMILGVAIGPLSGCGGENPPGGGSPPTRQTRDRVIALHRLSLRSLGLSGLGEPGLFRGGPGALGGAAGSGQPSQSGVPMLGAFVRGLSNGAGGITRDGGGGSGGGSQPPDPGPFPDFYFDEWLGLWVQIESTATSYRCFFYADEAKQIPAGSSETVWPEEWNLYPQTYRTEYAFLAGSLAGAHGQFVCTLASESTGTMLYEDVGADGSRCEGTSTWSEDGYVWSSRWDAMDGSWSTDSGTFHADGSGQTQSADSLGYRSSYWYRADGSGHARIEGPDPGLPATITWDVEGNVRIVYADGTVETYPGYGWAQPVGVATQPEPGR